MNPFVCLDFQKQEVEHACWVAAGKTQRVPAQRMVDFVEGNISKDFPKTSYQPGIVSVDLNYSSTQTITTGRLQKAFVAFGKENERLLHQPGRLACPRE